MRNLLTILSLCFVSCGQMETKQQESKLLYRYWVSNHLEHYTIDSAVGGGQTMYGGGLLLRLDTDRQVATLGADFYWKNDSLYQGGEPGMSVKFGNWRSGDKTLLLNQKLLAKSIMLTSDRIGQSELDTFKLQGSDLLINNSDTLIPVRKPSKELEEFLDKLIAFHVNKNGG